MVKVHAMPPAEGPAGACHSPLVARHILGQVQTDCDEVGKRLWVLCILFIRLLQCVFSILPLALSQLADGEAIQYSHLQQPMQRPIS